MPQRTPLLSGPRRGPIARFLLAIAALLAMVAAAFLGALVFLIALGIVVIGTSILAVRLWWLRRRAGRSGATPRPVRRGGAHTTYEGEYTIVGRDEAKPRR